ncbi:MAG: hypothetical protein PHQ20_00615 [Candidatus Moranbacteria bacterium]|nr:hypothetical protein [Candidatus Moranbacteria bacterium]
MDKNKSAEDIFDDSVQIGFQDDDGLKSINDARFSYFSKYSDSQLDEIYEADPRARDVIEKIRKIRNR